MRSLFARLTGLGRPRRAVTCYLRENGPIAYELEVFGGVPRDRVETLLASGLSWAWKGRTREWTALSRVSLSAFLADLAGATLLIGVGEDLPAHLTDEVVKEWLRRFCRVEPSPVAAAASVATGRQLLFVQQHPSPTVSALLDALQVDRRSAARSAYARLADDRLESAANRL